ncbi:MAG: hypothetical protein ACI37Z_08195 [Candidatus Gastranaerophilaceae bacterium]
MNYQDIYIQIDKLLKSQKLDENIQIKAKEVKQEVYDILNGKITPFSKENFLGCTAKEYAAMTDQELLLTILKSCSEDVLFELENQFGEKSKISQMIREKFLKLPTEEIKSTDDTIMTLEYMLEESEKSDNRLYSIVCKYMDEKGYVSDADFYNSISMSRQNFARIRNKSVNIGKDTVLWIICGLKLDYIAARQVLNAAGYTFKPNDKRDVIISYIIKNISNYDLDMINKVLYHFGLRTFFEN